MNNASQLYENPPHASALIESLRDIGYSFRSALADIIDNSITAGATEIEINVRWNESDPRIWITDNGLGMSQQELFDAMKPGSRSPTEKRDVTDLGRFGLGLKTASFSQCRKLTVVSTQNDKVHGYCWDLDVVVKNNAWLIKKLTGEELDAISTKPMQNGTMVLWEKLDRVIDNTTDDPESRFNELISKARSHLELTFHRFIHGEDNLTAIKISLNNNPLISIDPFNSSNPATQQLPRESITVANGSVIIQPFILPHHSKVGVEEYKKYAGDEGYTKSQGFYVYRNKRLIDYGSWFRLMPISDANRLARVRIDIGNENDHIWQVDVKKSRVNPPSKIRNELKRIISRITEKSSKVYRGRGHVRRRQNLSAVWERKSNHGLIEYKINRTHPFINQLLCLLEDDAGKLNDLLMIVETSLPRNQLFADMSSTPKDVDVDLNPSEVLRLAKRLYEDLLATGIDKEIIWKMISSSEPFCNYDGLENELNMAE